MTILEAKRICSDYYNMTNPSEEDTFLYTEALKFLIEEAKDADYMVELGGLYYEDRQFDLALKYYELAAEYNRCGTETEKRKRQAGREVQGVRGKMRRSMKRTGQKCGGRGLKRGRDGGNFSCKREISVVH